MGKLGNFLKEVSNWDWERFVKAERDKRFTSNQAIIFALIRACAMEKMDTIKISLERLDGKLETPVKIEYPKIFFLFPNATALPAIDPMMLESGDEVLTGEIIEVAEESEVGVPSMGIRDTLRLMADEPRDLPAGILKLATKTEDWIHGKGSKPKASPMVKSVVAAHLLTMAQNRNIGALYEIFDQIDGKLVETFRVLGEDMYITNYSLVAPPGATFNNDGVLQIEASSTQSLWANKFKETLGKKR